MKQLLSWVLIIVSSTILGADIDHGRVSFKTTRDIKSAIIHLHIVGLERFFAEIQSSGVPAPAIHSKYWVDQSTKNTGAIITKDTTVRDFGYEIALQLDRMAVDIHNNTNDLDNAKILDWLLSFKEWILSPGGYENFRIAARAENAATMPLLRLIMNLSIPNEDIERFFERFIDETQSARLRANILHEESSGLFDLRGNIDLLADQERLLANWWVPRAKETAERYGHRVLRYMYDFDMLNKDAIRYNFFCPDDDRLFPRNLSNNWDNKEHKLICVFSIKADRLDSLRQVFAFRKAAGKFLDVTVPNGMHPRHAYEDFYDAAFPKEKKAGLMPSVAGAFYLKNKSNSFIDTATAETIEDIKRRAISKYEPSENANIRRIIEARRKQNEAWMANKNL